MKLFFHSTYSPFSCNFISKDLCLFLQCHTVAVLALEGTKKVPGALHFQSFSAHGPFLVFLTP